MSDDLVFEGLRLLAGGTGFVMYEFTKGAIAAAGKDTLASLKGKAQEWRRRREANAIATINEAERMVLESGQRPREAPNRVIFKYLEYASLEENAELRRRWAALLANAVMADDPDEVLPGFVETLRQLTPQQAKVLQWLYEMGHVPNGGIVMEWPDVPRQVVQETFGLNDSRYALLVSDLERMQLIEGRRKVGKLPLHQRQQATLDLINGRWDSRLRFDWIGPTTFGVHFLRMCTPPSKKASPTADA